MGRRQFRSCASAEIGPASNCLTYLYKTQSVARKPQRFPAIPRCGAVSLHCIIRTWILMLIKVHPFGPRQTSLAAVRKVMQSRRRSRARRGPANPGRWPLRRRRSRQHGGGVTFRVISTYNNYYQFAIAGQIREQAENLPVELRGSEVRRPRTYGVDASLPARGSSTAECRGLVAGRIRAGRTSSTTERQSSWSS